MFSKTIYFLTTSKSIATKSSSYSEFTAYDCNTDKIKTDRYSCEVVNKYDGGGEVQPPYTQGVCFHNNPEAEAQRIYVHDLSLSCN